MINVNMLRLRLTMERHPRVKNIPPAHKITGVAMINSIQPCNRGAKMRSNDSPGIMLSKARKRIGRVSIPATRVFRPSLLISLPSSSSSPPPSLGSRSIPHLGHAPGPSCCTSGCIGQVQIWLFPTALKAGLIFIRMPHFGQSPGSDDSTPSHIGQKYLALREGLTEVVLGS